jgi:hypothetical protein
MTMLFSKDNEPGLKRTVFRTVFTLFMVLGVFSCQSSLKNRNVKRNNVQDKGTNIKLKKEEKETKDDRNENVAISNTCTGRMKRVVPSPLPSKPKVEILLKDRCYFFYFYAVESAEILVYLKDGTYVILPIRDEDIWPLAENGKWFQDSSGKIVMAPEPRKNAAFAFPPSMSRRGRDEEVKNEKYTAIPIEYRGITFLEWGDREETIHKDRHRIMEEIDDFRAPNCIPFMIFFRIDSGYFGKETTVATPISFKGKMETVAISSNKEEIKRITKTCCEPAEPGRR